MARSRTRSSRRRKKEFPQQLAGIVILEIAAIAAVFYVIQWASVGRDAVADQSALAERGAPQNVIDFVADKLVDRVPDFSAELAPKLSRNFTIRIPTTFPNLAPSVEQSAAVQRNAKLPPINRTFREVYPYPEPAEFAATEPEFSLPKVADRRYNRHW